MRGTPLQPFRRSVLATHAKADARIKEGNPQMNKDQVAGKADQVTGKVKQKVGEAVGDENMANRGVGDQVKGAAKETWGNVKDAANQDAKEDAHNTRENISRNVEDSKNRVNDKIDAIKEQHRMNEVKNRTA
jgi:uncharacterized protein YjbJ (UPF0337 family)